MDLFLPERTIALRLGSLKRSSFTTLRLAIALGLSELVMLHAPTSLADQVCEIAIAALRHIDKVVSEVLQWVVMHWR